MNVVPVKFCKTHRPFAVYSSLLSLSLGLSLLAGPALAKPAIPQNLGNGLYQIMEEYLKGPSVPANTSIAPDALGLAMQDAQGRVLVDIHMDGSTPMASVKRSLRAEGMQVTAETERYRAGVLEGYVPLNKVPQMAQTAGVSSMILVPKPITNIGRVTSQAIVQHRIQNIPGWVTNGTGTVNGSGITVGVLSDSYNTSTSTIKANNDIASGDLPGKGNTLGNTQPVVILQDNPAGTDEGRAMLQIIHDTAPRSRLCFATAFAGIVSFANNIRALGNPTGTCRAQVVVDDVIYFAENMFSDGIIAQAVDDVAAQGVAYFSSAGNLPPTQAYASDLRLIPVAGAPLGNLNLSTVPPALYAGGFHNFDATGGTDISQSISITTRGTISFQWDEPYDLPGGGVLSDFNLLFFDTAGNFLFAAQTNNLASNQPLELQGVTGTGALQMVIARANTPAATPTPASRLRYVWFTSGTVNDYFAYSTPTTFGHNSAVGANGTAAYSPTAPFLTESFTSVGPVTIAFDLAGNRLPTPQVRLKPDVAAMDGAFNTFFPSIPTPPAISQFFGTSAAAPQAAAIAALVLQRSGGPGSVTPAQMKTILQTNALPHDLDPNFARGVSADGTVTITAIGDIGQNINTQIDPNFFRVSYAGPGSVASIQLNGGAGSGGNQTQSPTGIVFDNRVGPGFPLTFGLLQGISAAAITFTPLNTPAIGNIPTVTLNFASGSFNAGAIVSFGIDRDTAFSGGGGNSADLLGGGVFIPSGTVAPNGLTFTVTFGDNTTTTGSFVNNLGTGYSFLDGFGFINAQTAVP
ncbi:S8 family peptidase [Anthocerotibacter panamensis]|uniref:S8 family peptidase n=1 Tax=Anthocerotibacter panamensis TaxID=2857077 RepID=UPI001C404DFB|nr:S8 family serine peptidase [Anthocerotibacter panamensis]